MKQKQQPLFLFRWLVIAALLDWLVTRTLTRSAIFMPKSPGVIAAYQGLTLVGQMAFAATALIAIAVIGYIVWASLRTRGGLVLALLLASSVIFSIIFLFMVPGGWFAVGYQLILLLSTVALGLLTLGKMGAAEKQLAAALPAMALLSARLHQAIPALFAAMGWSGPPLFSQTLFNLGELLIVLSSAGFWWAYGRQATARDWLIAALPALAFLSLYSVDPATTGIISIWSIGLSLYLPWPLYVLSLWLAGVVVTTSLRRDVPAVGWAVLLLAAGGHAPQLSSQAFLGLAALWLLAASSALGTRQNQAATHLQDRMVDNPLEVGTA